MDKMSDLISRQAAIKWVKTECNPYGKPTLDFESGKKIIEHLEQMPTIDPVKHGMWLRKELDKFRKYEVVCSECGARYVGNYDAYDEPDDFNYCPNCGAKMDGGKDDQER